MKDESQAERRLREAFAEIGFRSGGEFYLPASAASIYAEECAKESLAIIGIEVFALLPNQRLKPDLGMIADFADVLAADKEWATLVRQALDETKRFLARLPPHSDYWLNFTLLSEDETTTRSE